MNADKFIAFLIESSNFPPLLNTSSIYQALAISVIFFESVACILVGVHPRQLWFISTNKKRNNNRTFLKLNVYCKFHQFAVFQPEDWPWQFYAHRTSSLMSSLHEHCHLSTADNSCPAQCYIPNDTPPENQTQQVDHSVNCDNDWDTPHFSKQPCKNIHLFIHSFILSFWNQSAAQIFQEGKLADNPTPGEWV